MWGTTKTDVFGDEIINISIHVPRVGNDITTSQSAHNRFYFNPRSPCGERLSADKIKYLNQKISIHVPRVGNDKPQKPTISLTQFQSTFPVWGTTTTSITLVKALNLFQSTFPVWGTTVLLSMMRSLVIRFQSTFPVWGTTRDIKLNGGVRLISIHVPRVGNDQILTPEGVAGKDFNPRSPCGERPYALICNEWFRDISIHVPRVGNDFNCTYLSHFLKYFNPRSPCGERQGLGHIRISNMAFQSTFPVWGTTHEHRARKGAGSISIHVPRVGNDFKEPD